MNNEVTRALAGSPEEAVPTERLNNPNWTGGWVPSFLQKEKIQNQHQDSPHSVWDYPWIMALRSHLIVSVHPVIYLSICNPNGCWKLEAEIRRMRRELTRLFSAHWGAFLVEASNAEFLPSLTSHWPGPLTADPKPPFTIDLPNLQTCLTLLTARGKTRRRY